MKGKKTMRRNFLKFSLVVFACVPWSLLIVGIALVAQTPNLQVRVQRAEIVTDTLFVKWVIQDANRDSDPGTAGIQPTILFERETEYDRATGETNTQFATRVRDMETPIRDAELLKIRTAIRRAQTGTDVRSTLRGIEVN